MTDIFSICIFYYITEAWDPVGNTAWTDKRKWDVCVIRLSTASHLEDFTALRGFYKLYVCFLQIYQIDINVQDRFYYTWDLVQMSFISLDHFCFYTLIGVPLWATMRLKAHRQPLLSWKPSWSLQKAPNGLSDCEKQDSLVWWNWNWTVWPHFWVSCLEESSLCSTVLKQHAVGVFQQRGLVRVRESWTEKSTEDLKENDPKQWVHGRSGWVSQLDSERSEENPQIQVCKAEIAAKCA